MFTRVAEKRMRERSFLEAFTGQYDLFGSTMTIALEGESTLVANLPGEPKRELVPKRGTMFDFKEQSGRSIEFKPDVSMIVRDLPVIVNGSNGLSSALPKFITEDVG
jgi:hypothetical protein